MDKAENIGENFEEKAKEMGGFISKEDWIEQGKDPEDWRSPEDFVKRGEEIIPILKDRLKKLEDEQKATIRSYDHKIKKIEKDSFEKARKEYEEKLLKITNSKKAAAEENDLEAYMEAEQEEKKLSPPVEPEVEPEPKYTAPADFVTWQEENQWYNTDQDMTDFAIAYANRIQVQKNLPDGIELYNEVSKKVKQVFPDKFKNPKREEAVAVEGDSPQEQPSNKKSFANLPESAKQTYHRLKKKFEMQGKKFTKEEYADSWFAQEA